MLQFQTYDIDPLEAKLYFVDFDESKENKEEFRIFTTNEAIL